MRDPGNKYLKAWAGDYEETPFFFEEKSERGSRIIAWTDDPDQTQRTFYALMESLPWDVNVLLKICVSTDENDQPLWSRYHGLVDRSSLIKAVEINDEYVFSNGMHQLCVKDPDGNRYVAFDDHGIFFLYSPFPTDAQLFRTLGFEERYAEPLYAKPHYQCAPKNSDIMEQKFVADLQLQAAKSDLDK